MIAPRKTPVRTCVACRREDDKREFVRVVRSADGEVRVDPTGKAPGRGASLCAELTCFESAVSKKRLAPALRASISEEDTERLRNEFESVLAGRQAADSRSGR